MAETENLQQPALEAGAYEIIRGRLNQRAADLRDKLAQLNESRKSVFGAIPLALHETERVTTKNNCIARDIDSIGKNRFLFGFNVFLGLKSEAQLSDVFAAYEYADGAFHEISLDFLADPQFESDFKALYKFYKDTIFAKFFKNGPYFFMVFQIGKNLADIKTFKWQLADGNLKYLGNRSDHEFQFPPQHEFEWRRTHRDLHRKGAFPHISIENRLFVEAVGGDLTIKIEDNTETGQGIYSEPVEHKDQTLDDAEIFYAIVGNLILLKIRPYQEKAFRYLVYNEKLEEVRRIDSVRDACVLLPEDQGIMFSDGYYLQLGGFKRFPSEMADMVFERRIASPNGEDHLFVFYQPCSGTYVLMAYNVIEQQVETPIVCNGYSIFPNGEVALFKASEEPQKHHAIQVWQTPFLDHNIQAPGDKESYLFKIGNPAIVRCMAECREVLTLLGKEENFGGLYVDLSKRTSEVLDSYFWLDRPEAFTLKETLAEIKAAATNAIDEFEKVSRLRRQAQHELDSAKKRAGEVLAQASRERFEQILQYVETLAGLRGLRGELIIRREIRYIDLAQLSAIEEEVVKAVQKLSQDCVSFLLTDAALEPYRLRIREHETAASALKAVSEARKLEEAVSKTGRDLEMLIEIVSNLKIEDATHTTKIVEAISAIYAPLNQIKAAIKNRIRDLRQTEALAEFGAQIQLIDQSVINYLDLCDTPERSDELMTRVMVQVEELEGRFSDFDEFIEKLTGKREEIVNAFEAKRLALNEARARKVGSLVSAAERILKGLKHRAEQMQTVSEIQGYFAGDLMAGRVREIIEELGALGDPVKADDLQARLKTVREDAVRQLKDRQELFVDGKSIIQFGSHKFSVNTQALELTLVPREENLCAHLIGTGFFLPLEEPELNSAKRIWSQELVSENPEVYRGEYLAYRMLEQLRTQGLASAGHRKPEELASAVQEFMQPRFAEGYVKGVHDADAALLLIPLLRAEATLGLLRYDPVTRACAVFFWLRCGRDLPIFEAKARAVGMRNSLFSAAGPVREYIGELETKIRGFQQATGLFAGVRPLVAAEYLCHEFASGEADFVGSKQAEKIWLGFREFLTMRACEDRFAGAIRQVAEDATSAFQMARDWLDAYCQSGGTDSAMEHVTEAAVMAYRTAISPARILDGGTETLVEGLRGEHRLIEGGRYLLNYHRFVAKLAAYCEETVPAFEAFTRAKHKVSERLRSELKLYEFETKVLASFVRNKLLDEVFLPLVGANLAKQIGVVGENTRTDRMGMLLLISPPGYGKTTLMEYVANRLGITFVKVNGPAIGHEVTSLDPAECKNSGAREEVEKLNLAFEMGDNVMIYLDDIQHCNPEFLQKFISLCDGQRKIEGVFHGKARTYDMRGKKVAIVMAGNPYTESGDKFKIPDMLANRADTYNLGDMIGGYEAAFKLSYLENALTSNSVLSALASHSRADIYGLIKIAETGSREGVELEGNYSNEQIDEYVQVFRKLLRVRDVLLRVNQEYIASAAQADAYRTEPPFKLQGSYRNMNRLAEKVVAMMNEAELERLIEDHYKAEAQTLTTGAEANLLKWRELFGKLSPEDAARWEDIRKTFRRNQLFGAGDQDPVGRLVVQLSTFKDGLDSIKEALLAAVEQNRKNATFRLIDPSTPADIEETAISTETLAKIWDLISDDRKVREAKKKGEEK